jgi:hypothetical protein
MAQSHHGRAVIYANQGYELKHQVEAEVARELGYLPGTLESAFRDIAAGRQLRQSSPSVQSQWVRSQRTKRVNLRAMAPIGPFNSRPVSIWAGSCIFPME